MKSHRRVQSATLCSAAMSGLAAGYGALLLDLRPALAAIIALVMAILTVSVHVGCGGAY